MERLGHLPVNNTGITIIVLTGRLGPLPVSNTGITINITVLMGRHGPLPVTTAAPYCNTAEAESPYKLQQLV